MEGVALQGDGEALEEAAETNESRGVAAITNNKIDDTRSHI